MYYLIHHMLIKPPLFILPPPLFLYPPTNHFKNIPPLIQSHPLLPCIFFISPLSLPPIPPLSRFLPKLKILQRPFSPPY
ncbi:proton-conducting transporter transmembrane domain-containing protein, partial [Bacillus pumilus]|uniref:proton-conducting transporter transmembrane domain-containing protein n=1 Tax=Bacillus pumilus TaxID=1408 RepID=UPI0034D97339